MVSSTDGVSASQRGGGGTDALHEASPKPHHRAAVSIAASALPSLAPVALAII